MAKVIYVDKQYEKKITHNGCGAVILYYPKDVITVRCAESMYIKYIICPNCNENVFV